MKFFQKILNAESDIVRRLWQLNIALTLAVLPLAVGLAWYFRDTTPGNFSKYILAYGAIPVVIGIIQIAGYLYAHHSRITETQYALAIDVLLISNSLFLWAYAILLGKGVGIEYMFFSVLALPFYYFPSAARQPLNPRALIWFLIVATQIGAAFLYVEKIPAVLPLPQRAKDSLRSILPVIGIGILVVYGILAWWKLHITQRILWFWEAFSHIGIPKGAPSHEIKFQVLLNRMGAIVISYAFIVVPGVIFLTAIAAVQKGEKDVWEMARHYLIASLIFSPVTIFSFYLHLKRPASFNRGGWSRRWSPALFTIFSSFLTMWLALGAQLEVGFHYFLVAELGGFMMVNEEQRIGGPTISTLMGSLLPIAFIYWWHAQYGPSLVMARTGLPHYSIYGFFSHAADICIVS